jgi:hypothetical protein
MFFEPAAEPVVAPVYHPSNPLNPYTNPLQFLAEVSYMPFLQAVLGAGIYVLGDFNLITSPSQWPLKKIATGIIAVKWIHSFLSESVRLEVAASDPTYTGDLIGATSVSDEITTLDSTFIGSFINAFFLLPFLYQAYHREQLYEYLPSLLYLPIDQVLLYCGIDIQYELRRAAGFITGVLGAVQPLNDLYLLLIIYTTDKSSFYGDLSFFKWMTAYIPLILVSLSWLGTQSVAVWTNMFYEYPVSELIMTTLTFVYMIWPTVLVSVYNFA